MDVRILGPVRVFINGHPLDLGPRRQRFVFAVLALEPNRIVPVDRLIDLSWSDEPPRTAGHAIQVCVSRLRSMLAAAQEQDTGQSRVEIETSGGGYLLRIDPALIDASRFASRLDEASTVDDDGRRIEILDEALGLWTGPALSGAAAPETRDRLCRGLNEARLSAMEDRIAASLRLGRHRTVLAELADLVAANPTRERMVGQLMLALYRDGLAGEALAAGREARRRLADELGLDPGDEFQRLEVAILRNDPTLAVPAATAETSARPARPTTPRELPPDVYAFSGRLLETSDLDSALSDGSVAVLTGIGGVGKTSLAVNWAHRNAERFPDGQLYIDLRGYHPGEPVNAEDALAALLGSLGVIGADLPAGLAVRSARYRSLLADRRMLVVLDNAVTADQVRPLLPGTASARVLVTSRDDLAGLVARDGARRLTVDVLPATDARLLLHRLVGDRTGGESAAVATLAQQCGRLPLALRVAADLVAAQRRTTITDLVAELADESRRLDLLTAGTDPDSAVRAVFSWSERHLPEPARRLFWLLGLHPGRDTDAGATAALAGVTLSEAERLVDILARTHLTEPAGKTRSGDAAGYDRWSMHDLLRTYARERATAEIPAATRRAALDRLHEHYLVHAQAAMDMLFPAERAGADDSSTSDSPDRTVRFAGAATAKAWLDAERGNLIAVAHDSGRAVELARTLARYLQVGYHNADAFAIHERALQEAEAAGDVSAMAGALYQLGYVCAQSGCHTEAVERYRQSLALREKSGDRHGTAACYAGLGNVDMLRSRHEDALDQYRRAFSAYQEAGDALGTARIIGNIGRLHWRLGDTAAALRHLTEAGQLFESVGDQVGCGRNLNDMGNAWQRWRRYSEAYDCHQRAGAILREVGDTAAEACAVTDLGRVMSLWGRHAEALAQHERALAMFRGIDDEIGESEVLVDLGDACQRAGRVDDALAFHRRAHAVADRVGYRMYVAIALRGQGTALLALGRAMDALATYRAARTLAHEVGDRYTKACALDGMAAACLALSRPDQARSHWQAAHRLFTALDVPDAEDVHSRLSELDYTPITR